MVRLWDADANLLAEMDHPQPNVRRVDTAVWNSAQSRIVTEPFHFCELVFDSDCADSLHLWEADGTPVATLQHWDNITEWAWNHDESLLLTTASDGTAIIWDAASGQHLRTLPHEASVYSGQWSADGARILTYSSDGHARVWGLP